jgi:uncharacterized membrane protein YfcA
MEIHYLATFFVAIISSTLSGFAHGGGGFVMGPYWLLSGMTPAQGATTGAFMSTGMTLSSLAAFRGTEHYPSDKRLMYALSAVAVGAAIFGAFILPKIDVSVFKTILAVITVAAIPLLFKRPTITQSIGQGSKVGFTVASLLLLAGSIINGSAISMLFTLTLMTFFSMPIMKVTALRRYVGLWQSIALVTVLSLQGYFVWQHALVALAGGSIGSYIGTKYAIKKGETFAKYSLAVIAAISSIALLLSA